MDKNTENQKTGGFLQGLFHRQESERPDILIANAQKKAQKRTQNQMDIQPVDSENRTAPQLRGTSRICKGTSIKGSLTSEENLILDGVVEGPLNSDGDVVVSGSVHGDVHCGGKLTMAHGANIEGNVIAQNAELSGVLKGNLSVEENAVLLDGSLVTGHIKAKSLRTAAKAGIHGQVEVAGSNATETELKQLAPSNTEREVASAILTDTAQKSKVTR